MSCRRDCPGSAYSNRSDVLLFCISVFNSRVEQRESALKKGAYTQRNFARGAREIVQESTKVCKFERQKRTFFLDCPVRNYAM